MKQKKTSILVIVFSVVLFFVGIYTCGKIIVWLLPRGNIKYIVTSVSNLSQTLIYSFVLGMLPISALLVWRGAGINNNTKRLFVIALILASIVIFTAFRRFWIIYQISKFPDSEQQLYFPLNQVQFELYMLLGLLVGSILSFFLFRKQTL